MNESILIVDDEKKIRDIIALFLQTENYIVYEAETGAAAIKIAKTRRPDLIILDVMLPDISGFDVCQSIRSFLQVPIIFLTALGDDEHHILGYRVGADDYLTKPFKPSILTLKVKRMLARFNNSEEKIHVLGGISLNENTHVCIVDGKEIALTNKEFALLLELMKNPGTVLSRKYLLRTIWGFDVEVETRVVDAMVKNLRRKLGDSAGVIKTVISVGYRLEA